MTKLSVKNKMLLILVTVIGWWCINHLEFFTIIFQKLYRGLFPFILGGAIAFVLNLPMSKIEKLLLKISKSKRMKLSIRVTSAILSLLLLVIVIGFMAFLLIPELVGNIDSVITSIPSVIFEIKEFIFELLEDYPDVQDKVVVFFTENIEPGLVLSNLLTYIVNRAVSFVGTLLSGIITILTSIIFAVYILIEKEQLLVGSKRLIYTYLKKEKADKVIELGSLINTTFSGFISGQCLDVLILGFIFVVVLSLFQFPYALLISLLITITALIPIFGAFFAMIIGFILIVTVNPVQALLFVIVFLVIQQLEENFIYPKVVGKSVGLAPIWTLLAIVVGGKLFGIIGMLLGLPLVSIIYSLIRKYAYRRLEGKNII